jgi:L-lactate dehydrogenase complex protein LldE
MLFPRVQLLATCLVDALFPGVGEAVVTTLTRAGVEVTFPPDQTCCGQPAFNAGFWDEARRMARHTIEVFLAEPDPVVIPSGSCAQMIRHGYLELFADDPAWLERARALAAKTSELSEFLVDRIGRADLGASVSARVAYHPSCHLLRGLGVDRQPQALLQAVEGLEVHRLEPECCGFGGVFAIDEPDLSGAMLERKLAAIQSADVTAVVGCDVSCLMQIEGGLRKQGSGLRCLHLAQLIAGQEPGLR